MSDPRLKRLDEIERELAIYFYENMPVKDTKWLIQELRNEIQAHEQLKSKPLGVYAEEVVRLQAELALEKEVNAIAVEALETYTSRSPFHFDKDGCIDLERSRRIARNALEKINEKLKGTKE